MSAGSALQELTNTNQSLSIVVDGSILETHTLNFSSQSGSDIGHSFNGKVILSTSLMFNQLLRYIK